jgi:hypothetical protein
MGDVPESKTVQLIYEHVKDAPDKQFETVKSLDDKVVKIFTVAGVVIGLAGLSGKGLQGGTSTNVLLVGALIAFIATAACAFYHLWPVSIRLSRHAGTLWNESRHMTSDQVRQQLISSISAANAHNEELLLKKSTVQTYALVTTSLEVIMVGAAIVVSRL